jgi:hypothetical protein
MLKVCRTILDVQHVSEHGVAIADMTTIETAINILNPSLVVIPDVLMDAEATLWSAFPFLGKLHSVIPNPHFELMFVPQGSTLVEWKHCLMEFLATRTWGTKLVTTIGVPKILHKVAANQGVTDFHRFELLPHIPMNFNVHMLGCWGGWREMKGHPRVTSWDTSLPVAAAQRNRFLEGGRDDEKLQLIEEIEVEDPRLVTSNAQFLAERLGG